MKINSLSFSDTATNWNLPKIDFDDLTLLVGASGVGKTQILKSILRLKAIAKGKSIEGTKWDVQFTTIDDSEYRWAGEFEKGERDNLFKTLDEDFNAKLVFETLSLNSKVIVERNLDYIKFNGTKTVKLAQDESVLHLLKEEELINAAYSSFQKMIFSDQVDSKDTSISISLDQIGIANDKLVEKYDTIEKIRASDENIIKKLYLTSQNVPEVFSIIEKRYTDIFPFVTDIKVAPLESDNNRGSHFESFFNQIIIIQIKEKNVADWIPQTRISSGMYRTLIHLSELYLCPEGTVMLIDEFENSLGINCIDELTDDLQSFSDRKLQFVVTSHHPYIINHIDYKHWKLVTRKGSEVMVTKASDIVDFSKSKQQAFMQLIQLEEFTTGITE